MNMRIFMAAATLSILLAKPAAAQRWSIDQLDVWSSITEGWELKKSEEGEPGEKELEWLRQSLHPDYQGVGTRAPMPINKAKLLEGMSYDLPRWKTVLYTLEPQRILLHGDTAVVHYVFSWFFTRIEEETEMTHRKGLVTTVLVKEKDKWLMLASHISDLE